MSPKRSSPRRPLDLADIQGNIVRPYGRFGFPITRHMFFSIATPEAGRRFVDQIRSAITTAQRWVAIDEDADTDAPSRPLVCLNIGFSFAGLLALGLPTRTLSRLPEEFIDGMKSRSSILGDIGPSDPANWESIWQQRDDRRETLVHVWVSLNAQATPDGTPVAALAERTAWLCRAAEQSGGVTRLTGHGGANPDYQDSAAIMETLADGTRLPTAKEHFGFTDAIADPAFAGQYEPEMEAAEVIGGGKIGAGANPWAPIATGEFILGHPSEAQELPPTGPPWSFMRNGTFMVYRKIEQDVAAFSRYVAEQGDLFQRLGAADTAEAGRETIMAKMVGRWRSGIPLAAARTWQEAQQLAAQWSDVPDIQRRAPHLRSDAETQRLAEYETMLTNFRYAGDEQGFRCPVAAHVRRTNPRDSLDPSFGTKDATPTSALTNRRRIMRRGAPYDDGETGRGVIFMALCSSLFRQFEFIQQQWVQYGASFDVGNDTDPLVGLRRKDAKFVIPADPRRGETPFICADIPAFVATRGGEYFFLPSLTALREIAEGSVDPT